MKLFTTLAILLVALVVNGANSITFAWNPNTETNLAGYRLYQGGSTRAYTTNYPTGTNTVMLGTNRVCTLTITNVPLGKTLYFAVTAFTDDGLESDYSDEVTFGFRPGKPQSLRLTGTTNSLAAIWLDNPGTNVVVQFSKDLTNWQHWVAMQTLDPLTPVYQSVYVTAAVADDVQFFRMMTPNQPVLTPEPLPDTTLRLTRGRVLARPPPLPVQ